MENQIETEEKKSKFSKKVIARVMIVLLVLGTVGAGGFFVGKPVYQELKSSAAVKSIQEKGVPRTYFDALVSVIHKLDELEKLDRSNEELAHKVAALEKELEEEKSKNVAQEAKEVTKELGEKLKGEAGSELARVLTGIDYKPPTHLLPHQLYTLALGYFRKQEYEQAAVLFSYLTELREDSSYQRSEVYLMNAISWFKLKHFKLSHEYVKRTLKKSDDDTSVHRKAILWQALIAKAEGNNNEAQRILTGMVARYPHSEEVAWVNQRSPASKHDEPVVKHEEPAVKHEEPVAKHEDAVEGESKAALEEAKEQPKHDEHQESKHEHE